MWDVREIVGPGVVPGVRLFDRIGTGSGIIGRYRCGTRCRIRCCVGDLSIYLSIYIYLYIYSKYGYYNYYMLYNYHHYYYYYLNCLFIIFVHTQHTCLFYFLLYHYSFLVISYSTPSLHHYPHPLPHPHLDHCWNTI